MAVKKTKETNTTISEKLEGLFELQNVDSGIDKLQILRGELPLEVSDLQEQIDKLNNHLLDESDNEAKINNLILEQNEKIKNSEALIEKYNKQQMKVRNNREFDAINKELEFQALEIQLANKKITSFESDLEENGGKIKLVKAKIRERKKFLKTKKGELDVIVAAC